MCRSKSRLKVSTLVLVALLLILSPPLVAQEDAEEELAALVRAVNRLVETLEQQSRRQGTDSNLKRVGLAVQILDIRSRQYDSLQKELRSLDDREQRSRGYLASQQNKLEHVKSQISETVDAAQRLELEEKRDQTTVYIENLTTQLEHFAQRRADLQSRIILLQQRNMEAESIVDDWLEELATRSNDGGE